MDSLAEQQRRFYEERERFEDCIATELSKAGKSILEELAAKHTAKVIVERIQKRSVQILDILEDEDGSRKRDMEAMTGTGAFPEFYERLRQLKDWHRRNPGEIGYEPVTAEVNQLKTTIVEHLQTQFSDEEAFGRYLDLHILHDQFVNLKCLEDSRKKDQEEKEHVKYFEYLRTFDEFDSIPASAKSSPEYLSYLTALFHYLVTFYDRCEPLINSTKMFADIKEAFLAQYEDLTSNDPLFCKPCGKAFTNQSVFGAHLPGKKHAKAVERMQGGQETPSPVNTVTRDIALHQHLITKIMEILDKRRAATLANIERRQALTAEELAAEAEQEEEILVEPNDDDSEDEEKPIYNPKNLPLGFDGKPIPYWLYKLHGLNFEFKCQICGDVTYRGPKVFQRHFQDWRHNQKMRQLGIPNTPHFQGVTEIADAQALYEKLKRQKNQIIFKADEAEEFEDTRGNVLSKKAFDDLSRQGLL